MAANPQLPANANELAVLIGIHVASLYRLWRNGKIPRTSEANYTAEYVEEVKAVALGRLTPKALAALREQLKQENIRRDPRSPHGPRPWDSEDGHRIACLLCGVQMSALGDRGPGRENHLLVEHQMTAGEYSEYCSRQGWGDAPTTSLYMRENRSKRRKEHPEEVEQSNENSRKHVKMKLRTDQVYARTYYDKRRKERQSREERQKGEGFRKDERIRCPLQNQDGSPCGFLGLRLRAHISKVHGMSIPRFRQLHPEVPLEAQNEQKNIRKQMRNLRRRKGEAEDGRAAAIEQARKLPFVTNRTAMLALNISEAGLFRWLKGGRLKKYKKGHVYSTQIIQILERAAART